MARRLGVPLQRTEFRRSPNVLYLGDVIRVWDGFGCASLGEVTCAHPLRLQIDCSGGVVENIQGPRAWERIR